MLALAALQLCAQIAIGSTDTRCGHACWLCVDPVGLLASVLHDASRDQAARLQIATGGTSNFLIVELTHRRSRKSESPPTRKELVLLINFGRAGTWRLSAA